MWDRCREYEDVFDEMELEDVGEGEAGNGHYGENEGDERDIGCILGEMGQAGFADGVNILQVWSDI